jgi:hypothetical protein
MNKELKYFKSIAKLAIKYSEKQSPEISELKNDIKALKEGYKHLEGIVESVEELIDRKNDAIINELTLRQKNLESNYEILIKQSDKSPAYGPEGLKEYSSAQLQKICGYKSAQTLYNRFKSNSLNPKKRKIGNKVLYRLSSEDLNILRQRKGKLKEEKDPLVHSGGYESLKAILKELDISSATFYRKFKGYKLKPKIKSESHKLSYCFTKEDKEKLRQDCRGGIVGKDSKEAKEKGIKPNMKDICYIAKDLGVSRFVAKKRVDEHRIKAVREGRKLLYDIDKIKLLKQDNENSSNRQPAQPNPAENKVDSLEKKVVAGAKIPGEQTMQISLKEKNKLPCSAKVTPYNYTKLDTICKNRNMEIKRLLELIDKFKIEIKYQTIKNVRTLYISIDDVSKIEGEILAECSKS